MTEVDVREAERKLDELLQAVENGFEVVISQGGKPLAQLTVHPVDRLLDLLRGEDDPWYAVVIEECENGYLATVPDLPPCIAAADTQEVVEELIREVIRSHLETLRLEGIDMPEPTTRAVYMQAAGRAAAGRPTGERVHQAPDAARGRSHAPLPER
ncbi:MAG TPA: type II toxin-antitoxin system prevent-host-death family antitoxin [Longimicrobium sp.]|nr:type II toxin-antitoxin system prevent-host-death family antitoxin [Longimicrobium sp.]